MSILYIEFIYPIKHYFQTIRKNEAIFDLIFPLLIGLTGYYVLEKFQCTILVTDAVDLLKTIITLLSILVGFTISSIAILATTSEKLNQETERVIGNKKINLYQLANITFIFVLFSEILTLVINLSAVVLISYDVISVIDHLNILIAVNIALISHILLINIRNITNFYFIFHYVKSGSS